MKIFAVIFLLLSSAQIAMAAVPVQGRLLGGVSLLNPKQVNSVLKSEGLDEIGGSLNWGIEVAYPVAAMEFGLRVLSRKSSVDEKANPTATKYSAQIEQGSAQLVARVNLIKTTIVRFDVFGGAGGANSTFNIKSASFDGELKRSGDGDFGGPTWITSYGSSLSIGFKQVYLVLEAGFENNLVKALKRTGNVSSAIGELDLSGQYFSIGLLFSGVSAK